MRDCAVCGTSHCPTADESYQAAVVASEPITDEDWMEVPEGSVLGIEPGAHTMRRSLIIPEHRLIASSPQNGGNRDSLSGFTA